MRILFFDMGSFTYRDVRDAMESLGHEVHTLYYHFADRYKDDFLMTDSATNLRRRLMIWYSASIFSHLWPKHARKRDFHTYHGHMIHLWMRGCRIIFPTIPIIFSSLTGRKSLITT